MTTETIQPLAERARAAAREQVVAYEQAQRDRDARDVAAVATQATGTIKRVLDLDVSVNPAFVTRDPNDGMYVDVVIESMTFRFNYSSTFTLMLRRVHHACGQTVSVAVKDILSLGYALDAPIQHICPVDYPILPAREYPVQRAISPAEEAFLAALVTFLAERGIPMPE